MCGRGSEPSRALERVGRIFRAPVRRASKGLFSRKQYLSATPFQIPTAWGTTATNREQMIEKPAAAGRSLYLRHRRLIAEPQRPPPRHSALCRRFCRLAGRPKVGQAGERVRVPRRAAVSPSVHELKLAFCRVPAESEGGVHTQFQGDDTQKPIAP